MTTRRPRQWAVALAFASALLVPPAAALQPATPRFTGADGLVYESAPLVVPGLNGELFYGPDFDVACGLAGRLRVAMDHQAELAQIIRRSGRKVVYTVAPDKSSVLTSDIDRANLPHGSCDATGLRRQRHLLDHYPDPWYLPARHLLDSQRRQTYLKTDLHWSTIGASIFAKALATRLDPRIGRAQRYSYGTTTGVGGLNVAQGVDEPETFETATPAGRAVVRTATGSRDWEVGDVFDHRWVSSPARLTYPGRTVLLGDSFVVLALENLRPIFRHGRFLWVDHVDLDTVIKAIKHADTVVFESVQVFLASYPLSTQAFRHHLRQALR